MRALISRITVSVSGRLTDPLKCTLLGGMDGCLPHQRRRTDRVVRDARERRSADVSGGRRTHSLHRCAPNAHAESRRAHRSSRAIGGSSLIRPGVPSRSHPAGGAVRTVVGASGAIRRFAMTMPTTAVERSEPALTELEQASRSCHRRGVARRRSLPGDVERSAGRVETARTRHLVGQRPSPRSRIPGDVDETRARSQRHRRAAGVHGRERRGKARVIIGQCSGGRASWSSRRRRVRGRSELGAGR